MACVVIVQSISLVNIKQESMCAAVREAAEPKKWIFTVGRKYSSILFSIPVLLAMSRVLGGPVRKKFRFLAEFAVFSCSRRVHVVVFVHQES
jgi:hypothetical protein